MKDTAKVLEVCEEEGFKEEETMKDTAKVSEVCKEEGFEEEAMTKGLWGGSYFGGCQTNGMGDSLLAGLRTTSILMRRRMVMLMLLLVQNQQPTKPIVLQGKKSKARKRKPAMWRTAIKRSSCLAFSKGQKAK